MALRNAVPGLICSWLLVVAAALGQETNTFCPTDNGRPLANPYMGWGIWAGPHGFGASQKDYTVEQVTTGFGDDAPLCNWVLIDWDWARLEPEEGKFNWTEFDQVVQYWAQRKKQFVVRFWVTDDAGWGAKPGPEVIPGWLWQKGLRSRTYSSPGSGAKVREVDYADPSYLQVYLPALGQLLASAAEHYDKPGTPVILLQVMGYGHWADWATWFSQYPFPNPEFKHLLLSKIMRTYIDTFHHIRLLAFAGPDWDTVQMRTLDEFLRSKALDVALANNFALIWTGFIDGLDWSGSIQGKPFPPDSQGPFARQIMQWSWRDHPIVAEGNHTYDEIVDENDHGTFDENLDVALAWHANFAHFYLAPGTYQRAMRDDAATHQRGLQSGGLGYRLVPTSLTCRKELPAGGLLLLKQEWVNRSVGRLYVRQPLKLFLTDTAGAEKWSQVDAGFDETSWLQDEPQRLTSVFRVRADLSPGDYDLRLALVDAAGKPAIRLPIDSEDAQGRYRIGTLKVLANPKSRSK